MPIDQIVSSSRLIHIDVDDPEASRSVENALLWQQKSVRISGNIERLDGAIRINGLNIIIISLGYKPCEFVTPYVNFIRNHSIYSIRFSPIIAFLSNPIRDRINLLINLGIDDIIVEKLDFEQFVNRLEKLLKKPVDYYETDDYFGPDRRRGLLLGGDDAKDKRGQGRPKSQMSVSRGVDGCTVLPASFQSSASRLRDLFPLTSPSSIPQS